MTRILIPRSDNTSSKIIEASDFEKYFTNILCDYVECGFTMTAQCPNILAVNVAVGNLRLNGLHINNSAICTITGLAACDTTYVYATICRDPALEPESWSFSTNLTNITPADSISIGNITTNATTV